MKKTVLFKNRSGRKPWIEFRTYEDSFLEFKPRIMRNEIDGNGWISNLSSFGELFYGGDAGTKPGYFFRHSNFYGTRFVGFMELGDSFLEPQKGGHTENLCELKYYSEPYHKISDDPVCYRMGNDEPFLDYRFYSDHAELKEGDFFDARVDYFPFAFIDHESLWNDNSVIYQTGVITGTLEGKPVRGVCHVDRGFMPETVNHPYELFGCIDNELDGIREDGRKESSIIHIDSTGKVFAYYWLEGEEPVWSDEIEMTTEWYRIPYMEDGTCIYQEAVYRFAGKEIHTIGRWGANGFTAMPRRKPGQSQVYGTWYEGQTPYRHALYCTFMENQEAFDYKLKEMGFDVVDG